MAFCNLGIKGAVGLFVGLGTESLACLHTTFRFDPNSSTHACLSCITHVLESDVMELSILHLLAAVRTQENIFPRPKQHLH